MQAIGAYNTEVEVDGDKKTICFLDTPGHEAFSAMRARGAQVGLKSRATLRVPLSVLLSSSCRLGRLIPPYASWRVVPHAES